MCRGSSGAEQRFRKAWVGGPIPPLGSMPYSRFSRLEEKKQRRRLALALVGTLAIVIFLILFGFKLFVGFSVFVESLHGAPSPTPTPQTYIVPPTLDPLPIATNSAGFKVSGVGQTGLTAILYVNNQEMDRVAVTPNGSFSTQITFKTGTNTVSAKLVDAKGNTSDLSNVLSTTIKKSSPILEIDAPTDNTTVSGDTNTYTIKGKTEDNTTVTVNGRFVVVNSDNTFSYDYPLTGGDNKLAIVATDQAGNATTINRTVTYNK